jgi:hypothetical protein
MRENEVRLGLNNFVHIKMTESREYVMHKLKAKWGGRVCASVRSVSETTQGILITLGIGYLRAELSCEVKVMVTVKSQCYFNRAPRHGGVSGEWKYSSAHS